jgi:hypothetical protein
MKPQKTDSLKLSAHQQGVKFLLGETKVKQSDFPQVEWTRTDGNVFSIFATATNAWKRKDLSVASRIRSLASIAMSGQSQDAPDFAAALEAEASAGADGYYILLGILTEICPNSYGDDEDEDDGADDDDGDCE